jgi:bacterial/archaeal transporter family protein
MWIVFAFLSAVFAGMTAILAKLGIKNIDSNLARAIRTIVVLIFSCLMVFIVGSQTTIGVISSKTLVVYLPFRHRLI